MGDIIWNAFIPIERNTNVLRRSLAARTYFHSGVPWIYNLFSGKTVDAFCLLLSIRYIRVHLIDEYIVPLRTSLFTLCSSNCSLKHSLPFWKRFALFFRFIMVIRVKFNSGCVVAHICRINLHGKSDWNFKYITSSLALFVLSTVSGFIYFCTLHTKYIAKFSDAFKNISE